MRLRRRLIDSRFERHLLQGAILVCACVPVGAGASGVLGRMDMAGTVGASHARYLSGLLLGVGLAFWACTPVIERAGAVVRTLAAVIVVGGLARLFGAVTTTGFPPAVAWPLVMELAVTPLLALWRERVERL